MAPPNNQHPHPPLRKIVSISIATTVAAILVVGLCNYQVSLQANIEKEKDHLRRISLRVKDEINILISETLEDLEFIASLPQFSSLSYTNRTDTRENGAPENIESQKRDVIDDILRQTNFSRIFILLPNGDHYLTQPYAFQKDISRDNFNLSERAYFRNIQRTGQPIISNSLIGVDNKLAVVTMVPLRNKEGDIIGYLGGVCHLHDMTQIIKVAGLDDFVEAFVVDSRGNLVAHPGEIITSATQEKYRTHPLVRDFMEKRGNALFSVDGDQSSCLCEEYIVQKDRDWLTVTCRLDIGWGLILCRNKKEIIQSFLPDIWRTTFLTGLLFLMISAIGIFFVRSTGLKWLDSQRALDKSKQRFADLLDLLPVMVCELDSEGYITYANRAALKQTGYEQQDLGRQHYHILQLFAPEDRQRVKENMAKVYTGGESVAHEYSMIDRDNNRIPVLVYSRPIKHHGVIQGLRGVAVDISDLKKTENLLRQSEKRFRLLYDNSPLPQQSMDSEGILLEVNRVWLETTGYSCEEVVGRLFADFLESESRKDFQAKFPMVKKEGSCNGVEFYLVKQDGTQILTSFTGKACYDEKGNFSKILCSFRDITEMRKAEQEKERYSQGLEKLNHWIKELIPAGADMVNFYDTVCRGGLDIMEAELVMLPVIDQTGESFTYVAAAGSHADTFKNQTRPLDGNTLCGWVALYGETLRVDDLGSDPRADQDLVQQTGLDTGILVPMYFEDRIIGGISVFRRKKPYDHVDENLLRLFAHRVEAILANHNLLICLEEMVEERTRELSLTHKQLLQAEKLSAVGSLSASIAHEFNNPLQGIMSIIKGIKKRVTLDKEDLELIDMSIKECERMRDLIAGLQEFNRPTSGKRDLVDIHGILDHVLLLTKKDHQDRGIRIVTRYDRNLPKIKVVDDQIKQVFLNLVKNAAEACSAEDTITISTKSRKRKIAISVTDTGRGIPADAIEHIFEPFYTSKPELKGIGLGLAVSYGIIKAHQGDIVVESEPGQGTLFTVYLPRIDHEPEDNADRR